jgi:hypothetical protein
MADNLSSAATAYRGVLSSVRKIGSRLASTGRFHSGWVKRLGFLSAAALSTALASLTACSTAARCLICVARRGSSERSLLILNILETCLIWRVRAAKNSVFSLVPIIKPFLIGTVSSEGLSRFRNSCSSGRSLLLLLYKLFIPTEC